MIEKLTFVAKIGGNAQQRRQYRRRVTRIAGDCIRRYHNPLDKLDCIHQVAVYRNFERRCAVCNALME